MMRIRLIRALLLTLIATCVSASPSPDLSLRRYLAHTDFIPRAAQGGMSNPPIVFQNQGVPLGVSFTLNCSTGMSCSFVSGAMTLTATGGGGFPRLDQVLDPTADKTFALSTHALGFSTTFPPTVTFMGSGLNDLTASGDNAGLGRQIVITIDGTGTPNTFSWTYSGTTQATGKPITGASQYLADGISIRFAATTGHTLNDPWTLDFPALGTFAVSVPNGSLQVAGSQLLFSAGTLALTGYSDVPVPSDAKTLTSLFVDALDYDGHAADTLVPMIGIEITKRLVDSGSVAQGYGILIDDQNQALSNWAIKTGLGKVQFGDNTSAPSYSTATNCSSSASPAVCGSAAAGSVAVPTGITPTLVVNTTAVTANSQILFTPDESLGTKLSVTCNSTIAQVAIEPIVTARTAATSFTIQYNTTITTNPICLSYVIIN